MAGVDREELFTNDATRKWITFHDLRATGITWMAVRGDEPLRIKQRAGHSCLATTEGYIRTAEELRPNYGQVFPPFEAQREHCDRQARHKPASNPKPARRRPREWAARAGGTRQ